MFIEISETNRRTGRTPIKIAMHEIHKNINETNKNGIHWDETYTKQNMSSASGAPFVVEFLDEDMDMVGGHGDLRVDEDGKPYFENSTVVGTIEQATVETINVNGSDTLVLMSSGYLYEQRYPKFVNWLRDISKTQSIRGSVEIGGKHPNNNISYDGEYSREYRVPKEFDYTGMAILFTETPADDNAILVEVNQLNKSKEEKTLSETNNEKLEEKINKINELNNELNTKSTKIDELQVEVNTKQEELNSAIQELKEKRESLESQEQELNELREFKKEVTQKQLISKLEAELSSYSDEEKSIAKDKIEKFSEDPTEDKIKNIVNEINSEIAKNLIEKRKDKKQKEEKIESNSINDLFGVVDDISNDVKSIEDLY
ncbi:hypothetical protein [Paraliobacillus ryukyuensis]|uniref:hypothetical protein n=1 Tax=Paraliobacillus ryukyuensis TaxID=200904 RepID=UPI0009A8837C|nr:hypothetical protein [Paraliobacillus ryukyuensis]